MCLTLALCFLCSNVNNSGCVADEKHLLKNACMPRLVQCKQHPQTHYLPRTQAHTSSQGVESPFHVCSLHVHIWAQEALTL